MTKKRGPNPHHLFPKKPAPKSASSSDSGASWWVGLSRDRFYTEAKRLYPVISESTFGSYTGKAPPSMLPEGWEAMP